MVKGYINILKKMKAEPMYSLKEAVSKVLCGPPSYLRGSLCKFLNACYTERHRVVTEIHREMTSFFSLQEKAAGGMSSFLSEESKDHWHSNLII